MYISLKKCSVKTIPTERLLQLIPEPAEHNDAFTSYYALVIQKWITANR